MNTISMRRSPLVRAVMLGTTALTLLGPAEVTARVGVTSATDGDPMGRPPAQNERVLRIGIDVQANEAITTRANDRAHLVFLDGTALTVGPNAQLTIDKFVYDPATKTGALAINASKGVFRLVGGKISKTNPIVITTPSSTIGIRGGMLVAEVGPGKTKCAFLWGKGLTFESGGKKTEVTTPGFAIVGESGKAPGQPTKATTADISSLFSNFEGTGSSSSGTGGNAAAGADQKVQTGFSSQNSGQTPAAVAGPTTATTTTTTPNAASVATKVASSNTVSDAFSNIQTQDAVKQAAADAETKSQTTQIIVTRGRFVKEPGYTNFNNQTLAVTPVPVNNQALQPEGSLSGSATDGIATITLSDGRSFTVPWKKGGGPFALSLTHPSLGELNGTGFVNASGTFFAYTFVDGSNHRMGFIGGSPTALAQFPTSGFSRHSVTNLTDPSSLPFANAAVGNDVNLKAAAAISSLFSTYSQNIGPAVGNAAATTPQTANYLQGTVAISGSGTGQKSYMGVVIGDYFRDYNTNTIFSGGTYSATYRLGANQQIGRLTSSASTVDVGGANSIFGPDADTMVYTPNSVRATYTTSGGIVQSGSTTRTNQASFDQPYTNLVGADYSAYTVATRTSSSASAEGTRTTQTMRGFAGGLVDKLDSGGNISTRAIGAGSAPSVTISTNDANNRVFANITLADWDTASTMASFNLGATVDGPSATSSFYNDKIYAARDRPAETFLNRITTVSSNGGDSDVTSRTALLSYNTAPVSQFFASQGVTPCSCEFMTWGWWGGDVRYNAGSSYNPDGRDRLNLATYVAGTLTTRSELNTLNTMNATATYTGHIVGNVKNGANSYIAAGTYSNAWSFGSQTGRASVSFDGATYGNNLTANTVLNGGGAMTFSTIAPIPSNVGPGLASGRSVTLNGAFANAPGVVAKGQLGNFQITGPAYQAGGTFAAQKP